MSQAENVLATSVDSAGSAMAEQEQWMDSLEAKTQQFGASVESLSRRVVNSNFLKFIVDTGTDSVNVLTNIIDLLGTMPTLLATISGGLSAFRNQGVFKVDDNGGISNMFTAKNIEKSQFTAQLSNDISALETYEKAVANGNVSTEAFADIMGNASVSAKEYAVQTSGATGSSLTFAESQKATNAALLATGESSVAASIGMKALSVAMNVGVMLLITEAIKGVVWIADQLVVTTKELEEEVKNSKSVYDSAKSSLNSVNSELEEQTNLMKELESKGDLTYAEKGQLEELKEITKELQVQAEIAKNSETSAKETLAVNSAKLLNKQYDVGNVSLNRINELSSGANITGNNAILVSDENDLSSMIAGYKEFIKLKDEAYNSGNNEDFQHYLDMTDALSSSINNSLFSLEEQKANMKEYYNSIVEAESSGKSLTSSQKLVKDAFEQTSNAIELIYKELDPEKWNEIQFNSVFDSEEFEKSKKSLQELAKSGKLDESVITSNSEYKKLIEGTGLTAQEVVVQIKALNDEIAKNTSSSSSPSVFDFTTNEEAINLYQSSVKELSSALESLNSGTLTDSDMVDLLQSFPELQGKTDDLSGAIKDLVNDSLNTLLSQLGESAPTELVNSLQGMADSVTNLNSNLSDTSVAINALDQISDSMDKLDSAYAKFIDVDDEIDLSTLKDLQDTFGNLSGFEDFMKVISGQSSTADQVKQAFGSLTGEYITQSGVLKNLTFDNAELMATQLKVMGIANSEEIVYGALGVTIDQYAQLKAIAAQRGIDLANITYQEIQALLNENQMTQETAQSMYIFALRKALANDNVLSTTSDIQNLMSLVTALGGATTALQIYNAAKTGQVGMGGMSSADMETMKQNALNEANQALTNALNSTTNLSNAANNIDYTGGADTASALENNLKKAQDAAKDAADALKEAYDAYTKLMSHRESMGIYDDDPMTYVKDLGVLVNEYVYDQETAWDAEEKIYQARQKYMDEWVSQAKSVYSSLLKMLDTYQTQLQNKIDLGDGNVSNSTYKKLFNSYVTEAKKYADERNYLQKQLNDYLKAGGTKGDDRWTELTEAIAEANTKIDETKLSLKSLVEEYTSNWSDAIENVYDSQITSLEKYQSRLESLYNMTGDSKYLQMSLQNYVDTLSAYETKYSEQQKAIQDGLKSGLISTDSSEGYKYDEYLKLQEALDETNDSVNTLKENLKDFADNALQNWIDSVENLGSDVLDLLGQYQNDLDAYISKLEANSEKIGESFYTASIDRASKAISVYTTRLKEAQDNLKKGLDNGSIVEGDETWQSFVTTINEANNAIIQGQQEIIEYNNALMQLSFDKFDDLIDKLSSISDEIENVVDLIDNADLNLFNEDASFSDSGLTTLALQLQQREAAMYSLQQVNSAISQLNSDYSAGKYDMSEAEYTERLNELKEQQYSLIEKIQDAESDVLDIYQQQQEAQIQLIQDKIDALQKENDEYQRAIDLQKARFALEQAMNNRNKMVFTGKEFEYTVDQDAIDSARSTLSDLELNAQVKELEDQIETIKAESLKLADVLNEAIDLVNENASTVYEKLMEYSELYGITIDEYIIAAWDGVSNSTGVATNALTKFGTTVTTTSSKSVVSLNNVKTKIDQIYTTSNTTASQIVTMLTPDTTYIETKFSKISGDITTISNNANTANLAITSWNNISLATFNQTTTTANTGVSTITSSAKTANSALTALNSIDVYTDAGKTKTSISALTKDATAAKTEVEGIKTALDKLKDLSANPNLTLTYSGKSASQINDIGTAIGNLKSKKITVETNYTTTGSPATPHGIKSGSTLLYAATSHDAATAEFNAHRGVYLAESREVGGSLSVFADGGVVTKSAENQFFDPIAKSMGEHHLVGVKERERILKVDEAQAYQDFVKMAPSLVNTLQPLVSLSNPNTSSMVVSNMNNSAPIITIEEGAIQMNGVQDVNGLSNAIIRRLPQEVLQKMNKL